MRAIIFVLLTVSFFRLFQLSITPTGLYWDELDTGYQAYSLLNTGRDYFGNLFPAHLQSFADYRSALYMYLTVPVVKVLGLSAFSVRLPAVISSLLTLLLVYWLSRKLLKLPSSHAWIAPAVWGLSPWTLVQSRIAAESMLLPLFTLLGLSLYLKFRQTSCVRWLMLAGFFLGLTAWTYGTAKIFLPIFLFLLAIYHFSQARLRTKTSAFILPIIILFGVVAVPASEVFRKNVSMRFSELSVFTDPVMVSEIDFHRLESALSRGQERVIGMQPSFIEKILYNKPTYWFEKITSNYLKSLSTTFLFSSGDPQIRHNINAPNTGQFYAIELLAFLFGLITLISSNKYSVGLKRFLILWLLLAPLASIITRDGGDHAPRLLPLLAPMVFIISLGVSNIFSNPLSRVVYSLIYLVSVVTAGFYLFGPYRSKSAVHFNTGFIEAVKYSITNSHEFDRVILDGQNESFLMAYLFTTRFNPAVFQSSFPLPATIIDQGVEGYHLGNYFILYPGTRDWNKINLTGKNLVISATSQPNVDNLTPLATFNNPDGSTALTAFVK